MLGMKGENPQCDLPVHEFRNVLIHIEEAKYNRYYSIINTNSVICALDGFAWG
jgi:hypothetical protein